MLGEIFNNPAATVKLITLPLKIPRCYRRMRLEAEFLNEGVHVDANPEVEVDTEEQGISNVGSNVLALLYRMRCQLHLRHGPQD